ncbi:hypothetical protein ACFVUW_11735 [Streptomyces xiamenensis]|uniref:hypothetical protein n=1 Tax=Streptomyces xiamenensis TaxID=408015 RepID=UPI0036E90CB4
MRTLLESESVTLDHTTVDLGVASQQMFSPAQLGSTWTVSKDRADGDRLVLWGRAPFGGVSDRPVEVDFVPVGDKIGTLLVYIDTAGDWARADCPYHATLKDLGCHTPEVGLRASSTVWPLRLEVAGAARFGEGNDDVPHRLVVREGSPGFSTVHADLGSPPPAAGDLAGLISQLPLAGKITSPTLPTEVTGLLKGVTVTLSALTASFREQHNAQAALVGLSVGVNATLAAPREVIPGLFTATGLSLEAGSADGRIFTASAELTGKAGSTDTVLAASYTSSGHYQVCGTVTAGDDFLRNICQDLGLSLEGTDGTTVQAYISVMGTGTGSPVVEVGLNGSTTATGPNHPVSFAIRAERTTGSKATAAAAIPLPAPPGPNPAAREALFAGSVESDPGKPVALSLSWSAPTDEDAISLADILAAIV